MNYPQLKFQESWVRSGIDPTLLEYANSFGEFLKQDVGTKALTTSQIRRFFGEIRRIEADYHNLRAQIIMISPKLAYAVGRDLDKNGRAKSKIHEFYIEIKSGLSFIRYGDLNHEESDFKNFVKVVEAIVAYHKFHGGN